MSTFTYNQSRHLRTRVCKTVVPTQSSIRLYTSFNCAGVFLLDEEHSIIVGLAPLMVVFVLMTCCATASGDTVPAAPNMKVANNLKHENLTLWPLPGCCSPCGRDSPACAIACAPCGDVVVPAGSVVALDLHVGPCPLQYMTMEVFGKVWCVELRDLMLIKPWVTLAVGPGGCGPHNGGIEASVFVRRDKKPSHVTPLCLYQCFYKV